MAETYRSLIVIFMTSIATFWLSKQTLPQFLTVKEFSYWRNIWFAIVITAFIAPNIWFFCFVILIGSIFFVPGNLSNRPIYYILVLCAIPQLEKDIPGFGGIRYIFSLNYPRLLVLTLFLAPFVGQYIIPFFTNKRSESSHHISSSTDKFVLLYIGLIAYLNFRDNTTTNALREFFLILLDIYLPYFMISRYIVTIKDMNRFLTAMLIGLMPLAVIGILETLRHWNLYSALSFSLTGNQLAYDIRSGALRASGPFSGPIVFGYVLVVTFGLLLYLKPLLKNKMISNLAGLVIVISLISTMARGPWVGFIALILAYLYTGKSFFKHLSLLGAGGIVFFTLISFTKVGKKIIDLLPFIGTTRSDTIDYRERLIENAWIVFQDNPWLGSTTFLETEEMESMRQGQGIIDLVNTYIQIALPYGAIGLMLFISIFLGLLIACFRMIKKLPSSETDLIRMGRIFFAIILSTLLIIFTMSSIDYIPNLYWAFSGLMVSYLHISRKTILTYSRAKNA